MAFKALVKPKQRLADQVYDQIMEAIRNGEIDSTNRIVQERLADELKVSRTPVREALFRMAQEGIMEVADNGGFLIRQHTSDEISELYSSRCAIEGYAARILAEANDPAIFGQLYDDIAKAENLSERTVQGYFQANMSIHRNIVAATRNHLLLEFFDNIWNRGTSYTMFASIQDDNLARSLGNHQRLIDAMATGNGSAAAEEMIDHIRDGYRLQLAASAIS